MQSSAMACRYFYLEGNLTPKFEPKIALQVQPFKEATKAEMKEVAHKQIIAYSFCDPNDEGVKFEPTTHTDSGLEWKQWTATFPTFEMQVDAALCKSEPLPNKFDTPNYEMSIIQFLKEKSKVMTYYPAEGDRLSGRFTVRVIPPEHHPFPLVDFVADDDATTAPPYAPDYSTNSCKPFDVTEVEKGCTLLGKIRLKDTPDASFPTTLNPRQIQRLHGDIRQWNRGLYNLASFSFSATYTTWITVREIDEPGNIFPLLMLERHCDLEAVAKDPYHLPTLTKAEIPHAPVIYGEGAGYCPLPPFPIIDNTFWANRFHEECTFDFQPCSA